MITSDYETKRQDYVKLETMTCCLVYCDNGSFVVRIASGNAVWLPICVCFGWAFPMLGCPSVFELRSGRGSGEKGGDAVRAARKSRKPGGHGQRGLLPSTVSPGVSKWKERPSRNRSSIGSGS